MTLPRFLSSLLLSTSLLAGSACSTAARAPGDASPGPVVSAPVKADTIDRATLRAALASRRAASIDRFLAYRDARVYPVNTFAPGMQHVWLDERGNLCAAATLISGDWGRDAASAVAFSDNFIRLADVQHGPLLDWILTSGLTHHEIVAIQEPGFSRMQPEPEPAPDDPGRIAEIDRLFVIYNSVERQLRSMNDASLDAATDALMARPDLAKRFLDGELPGPGRYLEEV